MSATDWWLSDPTGTRRRVPPGGVLIGRSTDCDILVVEPEVSRHQALVYLEGGEAKLVTLGSAPCLVDGQVVDAKLQLRHGSTIRIGELELTVRAEARAEKVPCWLVQMVGGGLYSVAKERFTIGGGSSDDLRVDGLAQGAVALQPGADFVAVEAATGQVKVAGKMLEPGDVGTARVSDLVKVGPIALRILAGDAVADATMRHHLRQEIGASLARLSFLPRGGRMELDVLGQRVTVYLAERRCNLVACLLQPPDPFKPGDFVDDEVLIPRVWPNQARGRTDLNTLLHRARKDLVAAGIDGASLIERADGGGATRFALQPNAVVAVE